MGYKVTKTVFKLVFHDGQYEGLEVRATAPPLGFLKSTMAMAKFAGKRAEELSPEELDEVMTLFSGFAEHLVSWNLENDDDTPVPATLDGLQAQELPFVFDLISAWMDASGGLSEADPLGRPSCGGRPSLEGSLPMETLSPSPTSSSGPSSYLAAVKDSGASRVS